MTCNVSSGTLNLTYSLTQWCNSGALMGVLVGVFTSRTWRCGMYAACRLVVVCIGVLVWCGMYAACRLIVVCIGVLVWCGMYAACRLVVVCIGVLVWCGMYAACRLVVVCVGVVWYVCCL